MQSNTSSAFSSLMQLVKLQSTLIAIKNTDHLVSALKCSMCTITVLKESKHIYLKWSLNVHKNIIMVLTILYWFQMQCPFHL